MNIYSHQYTLLKQHINLYLQTYKYLLFIILLSHFPLFPPNNFSCFFSIFKTKLHCHGHGVPRITHTFVSVCISLIIDTKFVSVNVRCGAIAGRLPILLSQISRNIRNTEIHCSLEGLLAARSSILKVLNARIISQEHEHMLENMLDLFVL